MTIGRRWVRVVLVCGLGAALCLALGLYYWPFLADDALISLRYAERFAQGLGLTWNDGYRVEGYSNLSWVLMLAGLIKLGADPVTALRGLGIFFSAAMAITALAYAARAQAWRSLTLVVILTLGVHPIWIWTIAGLEGPLVMAGAFFALLALDAWWRSGRDSRVWLWVASAILALVTLTRPDAPLLVAVAALLPLMGDEPWRQRFRNAIILVSLPLTAFALQMGFRLIYYDDWLPNTARVKVALGENRLRVGAKYVLTGGLVCLPSALALLALVVWRPRERGAPFWIAVLMAAGWAGYVAAVGGDNFAGFRHLLPAIGIILAAFLLARDETHFRHVDAAITGGGWVAAGALLALLVAAQAGQWAFEDNRRGKSQRFVQECLPVSQDLKVRFGAYDPVIAVTAAGCLPYWTGFETLDMLGLNDLELPHRKPEDFGYGWIGHELGDLDYVLEQAPEIVIFDMGGPPRFRYERLIAEDDRFDRAYCLLKYPAGGAVRDIYFRHDFMAEAGLGGPCVNEVG